MQVHRLMPVTFCHCHLSPKEAAARKYVTVKSTAGNRPNYILFKKPIVDGIKDLISVSATSNLFRCVSDFIQVAIIL